MNNEIDFKIHKISKKDRFAVSEFISENWGSQFSVSRGKMHDTTLLHGFICRMDNKIVGLVTYHIESQDLEIVTLDSKIPNKGLGAKLIKKVLDNAKKEKCNRVWLITTNDNTKAIRFYQKFGFEWVGFHKDAIEDSKKLKPEIPEKGNDNIPLKHEIEFEVRF